MVLIYLSYTSELVKRTFFFKEAIKAQQPSHMSNNSFWQRAQTSTLSSYPIPALSSSPHQVLTTSLSTEVWTASEHILKARNQEYFKAVYLFHLLDKYQKTVNIISFLNYLPVSHSTCMRTNDTLITPNQLLAFGHHQEAVVKNSHLDIYTMYTYVYLW